MQAEHASTQDSAAEATRNVAADKADEKEAEPKAKEQEQQEEQEEADKEDVEAALNMALLRTYAQTQVDDKKQEEVST